MKRHPQRTAVRRTRQPSTQAPQSICGNKLFFLLLIVVLLTGTALLQPEWLVSLLGLSRASRKFSDSSETETKMEMEVVCHTKESIALLRQNNLLHSRYSQSITNYFDVSSGILSADKIGLQIEGDLCEFFPPQQFKQLITAIQSFFKNNDKLLIGEVHTDYISQGNPYGRLFVKSILQSMPTDTVLFIEPPENELINTNEFNRPVVSLDHHGNNFQLSIAAQLLKVAVGMHRTNPSQMEQIKNYFKILFFDGDIKYWSQLTKTGDLTPEELRLCMGIIQFMKKVQQSSLEDTYTKVGNWIATFPLVDQINLFNLLTKFISGIWPHCEQSKNPVRRQAQIAAFENDWKNIQTFKAQLNSPTKGFNALYKAFNTNGIVVTYRNFHWLDKIEEYLLNYESQHGVTPKSILWLGSEHIAGLKSELDKQSQPTADSHPTYQFNI